MINVEYINGSCYVVETSIANYVFDFVDGRLPSKYLTSSRPTYFIASSVLPDYYSDIVFTFRKTVILPSSVLLSPIRNTYLLDAGDTFHMGTSRIKAFNACNQGLCFMVEDQDMRLFWAGPLTSIIEGGVASDYQLETQEKFFKEGVDSAVSMKPIDLLFATVKNVGIQDYDAGARYLIDMSQPKFFFPTGFGPDSRDINAFFDRMKENQKVETFDPKFENKVFRNVGEEE